MVNSYKKILLWIISFGRTKSVVISFLLLSALLFLIQCIIALTQFLLGKGNYFHLLSEQVSHSWGYVIFVFIGSWGFYNDAKKSLKHWDELEVKGLTTEDVSRIEFTKNWDVTRKNGIKKFCFYDGGIIAGMLLVIPISMVWFFVVGSFERLYSGFLFMLFFIGITIILGYLSGVIIYYVRWKYNERKFRSLTDPLH